MHRSLNYLIVAFFTALLAACGGGGSDSSESATGSVSFDVTDAPTMEFEKVIVTFTGMMLKPADGERLEFTFEEPKTLDLLTLQGGETAPLLEDEEVPAGKYNWIRLTLDVDTSYVIDNVGNQKTLFIPSGAQTGLKLIGGVSVAQGGQSSYTIDFDVRKSIVDPKGGQADYYLKPVLRLIEQSAVGSITGQVDYATINSTRMASEELANCEYEGSIYVFSGADVTPTDLNVNAPEDGPLLVVPVVEDEETSLYSFTASFLSEGDYTISYACEMDDNEAAEDLRFEGTQTVIVIAGAETTADPIPMVE